MPQPMDEVTPPGYLRTWIWDFARGDLQLLANLGLVRDSPWEHSVFIEAWAQQLTRLHRDGECAAAHYARTNLRMMRALYALGGLDAVWARALADGFTLPSVP